MSKNKGVKETSAQRAFADVTRARMDDFKQRWQPVLKHTAAAIVRAGEEGSFQRKRAAGQATTDVAAAFAPAQEALLAKEAAGGQIGSSAHKLGLAAMGNDAATSAALNTVQADQNVDDATQAGLATVAALGRGEKATATNGLAASADLTGRQAAADAEASLADRIATTGLVAQAAGAGAGLAANGVPMPTFGGNTDDYRGTMLPNSLRGGGMGAIPGA